MRRRVGPRRDERLIPDHERNRRVGSGQRAHRIGVVSLQPHDVGARKPLSLDSAKQRRRNADRVQIGRPLDLRAGKPLHPVAQGEHGNECAHAHDDPERGEESAERIRAERVEADPKGCRDDGTEHVMRGQ